MSDDYQRRIDRINKLLADLGASGPDGFMAIQQKGGLAPFISVASDDLNNEWIRDMANETEDDFITRAVTESRASGAKRCHLNSMASTGSEALKAAAKAASDWFYANEYSSVPEIEENPWSSQPRRSRLGWAG